MAVESDVYPPEYVQGFSVLSDRSQKKRAHYLCSRGCARVICEIRYVCHLLRAHFSEIAERPTEGLASGRAISSGARCGSGR